MEIAYNKRLYKISAYAISCTLICFKQGRVYEYMQLSFFWANFTVLEFSWWFGRESGIIISQVISEDQLFLMIKIGFLIGVFIHNFTLQKVSYCSFILQLCVSLYHSLSHRN